MRYLAALCLVVSFSVEAQTHVYACPVVPTSTQGAPSSACSADGYFLPAQVTSAYYLAACSAGACYWGSSSIAWRQRDSVAADWLMYACPQASEGGCTFVPMSVMFGGAPPPPPPPSTGGATLSWVLPVGNADGRLSLILLE